MTASFFTRSAPITFDPDAICDGLACRWNDPDKKVLGKRMEDQLRFAVCDWHSFA